MGEKGSWPVAAAGRAFQAEALPGHLACQNRESSGDKDVAMGELRHCCKRVNCDIKASCKRDVLISLFTCLLVFFSGSSYVE